MVGTHLPDERDRFQSALQRMREAFEGLREAAISIESAELQFRAAYAEVAEIAAGRPSSSVTEGEYPPEPH